MIENQINLNKRDIEDALNRLIGKEELDDNDKVVLAECVIENVECIILALTGHIKSSIIVDAEVIDDNNE